VNSAHLISTLYLVSILPIKNYDHFCAKIYQVKFSKKGDSIVWKKFSDYFFTTFLFFLYYYQYIKLIKSKEILFKELNRLLDSFFVD